VRDPVATTRHLGLDKSCFGLDSCAQKKEQTARRAVFHKDLGREQNESLGIIVPRDSKKVLRFLPRMK
jgi:hypothetical protein